MKSYEYDAFGREWDAVATDNNPFRYCGEYYDKRTETVYLRARYYDSAYGRFTQQDGWQYADANDPLSLNLYTYCWNNPVNMVDPSGCWPNWKKLIDSVKEITKTVVKVAVTVAVVAATVAVVAGTGGGALVAAGIGITANAVATTAAVATAGAIAATATAVGALVVGGVAVAAEAIAGYSSNGSSSEIWKNNQSFEDIENKANHAFHNKKHDHHLDEVLESFNNDEISAYKKMTEIAQNYIDNIGASSADQFIINVNGFDVTVRGKVIDGFFRITTAYIPS